MRANGVYYHTLAVHETLGAQEHETLHQAASRVIAERDEMRQRVRHLEALRAELELARPGGMRRLVARLAVDVASALVNHILHAPGGER